MEPKKNKKEGRHIKVQRLRNSEMKATLGAQDVVEPKTYSCGTGSDTCQTLTVNIHGLDQMATTRLIVDIYLPTTKDKAENSVIDSFSL